MTNTKPVSIEIKRGPSYVKHTIDQLFHTPGNSKFQNFAAGVFHSHISYLWREIAKTLYYSSKKQEPVYHSSDNAETAVGFYT